MAWELAGYAYGSSAPVSLTGSNGDTGTAVWYVQYPNVALVNLASTQSPHLSGISCADVSTLPALGALQEYRNITRATVATISQLDMPAIPGTPKTVGNTVQVGSYSASNNGVVSQNQASAIAYLQTSPASSGQFYDVGAPPLTIIAYPSGSTLFSVTGSGAAAQLKDATGTTLATGHVLATSAAKWPAVSSGLEWCLFSAIGSGFNNGATTESWAASLMVVTGAEVWVNTPDADTTPPTAGTIAADVACNLVTLTVTAGSDNDGNPCTRTLYAATDRDFSSLVDGYPVTLGSDGSTVVYQALMSNHAAAYWFKVRFRDTAGNTSDSDVVEVDTEGLRGVYDAGTVALSGAYQSGTVALTGAYDAGTVTLTGVYD